MKPSKVLLVSVFITAIILVIIGGVTSIAMANKPSKSDTATTEAVQAYQQREAEYNQLIQQANQQLAEANAKLQAIQSQAAQNPAAAQPSTGTLNVAISIDKAEQIARQAADPSSLMQKKPDLVSFEGKAAYEVVFQKGSIYIDAQNGSVLFNGTVPQEITAEKAAQIASDYLQNKDILLVDQITFRKAPLYRVIFKNGMMVYLDTTGQITYILKSSSKIVESPLQGTTSFTSQPQSSAGFEHPEGADD